MFGFPQVKKAPDFQYKSNFLRSVTFQINYIPIVITEDILQGLRKILSDKYSNIENLIQGKLELSAKGFKPELDGTHGLVLSTKDGLLSLNITKDHIAYVIQGSAYKNYSVFMNDCQAELKKVIKFLKIEAVNRVAIRKVNILNFHNKEKEYSLVDVIGMLFNSKLVENMKIVPENKYLKKGLNNLLLINKEQSLNLTYGFVIDEKDSLAANGILDIDLFVQANKNIASIFSTFETINNEIYNVFCWALQDETRKQLDQ